MYTLADRVDDTALDVHLHLEIENLKTPMRPDYMRAKYLLEKISAETKFKPSVYKKESLPRKQKNISKKTSEMKNGNKLRKLRK